MSLKSFASKLLAKSIASKLSNEAKNAVELQKNVLKNLMTEASGTVFGKEHDFANISSHKELTEAVPIREYESFIPYIDRIKKGEKNILWPGLPMYFCKTSGTTSGTKYIPLTKSSLPNHIGSARNALLSYIAETGNAQFVDGKMIFLQGSPVLEYLPSGIPYGRLSGIVANHVPSYLQRNRMPSFQTNCIEDWETKVNAIADETCRENMTLISGIPSWVQMYFEILLEKTGKKYIREIFPDFNLFVFGGVSFEPYSKRFAELIGKSIPTIELYPASEGFIAFQDSQEEEGMLLNVHSGIYFEFIPVDEYFSSAPSRLSLSEVKTGVNYALILSNNAGLWSYSIGDTIKFVSLLPPRIKVTGRIKHFTSAFGEHVIAEEVEGAMSSAIDKFRLNVTEFHVAPEVAPDSGLPYHQWYIEFDKIPVNLPEIALYINNNMTARNVYYKDLIEGNVLRTLVITPVKKGAFADYMKSVGKLGGQNKVPRLANDRNIAGFLESLKI